MADSKTVLQKYVSDMLSLEEHIHQAIDKQEKANQDDPEMHSRFAAFSLTLKSHAEALENRLKQLGGAANHPVKEGVAAVAGVAAGVIDKLRSEELSKDYRDDFTALTLSIISYEMLHTTALAFGDTQTAQLAKQNIRDNVEFVQNIERHMPKVVVRELKSNHKEIQGELNEGATEQTEKLISQIWGRNK